MMILETVLERGIGMYLFSVDMMMWSQPGIASLGHRRQRLYLPAVLDADLLLVRSILSFCADAGRFWPSVATPKAPILRGQFLVPCSNRKKTSASSARPFVLLLHA